MRAKTLAGAVALAIPLACGTPPAAAQQASMSEEQVVLLNAANRELAKERPDLGRARALLEQAMEDGERFDLLLLTYGRVLQKQGLCDDAASAFDDIARAPHEPSQSREDIESRLDAFRSQMGELCPGVLSLECAQGIGEVRVGDRLLECGREHALPPGTYGVTPARPGQRRQGDPRREVRIVGRRTVSLSIGDTSPPPPAPKGRLGRPRASVSVLLGTSLGLVGFGAGGATPTANPSRTVSASLAPAQGHALALASWSLGDSTQVGLYARYQFSPVQDLLRGVPEPCFGLGPSGECAAGVRLSRVVARSKGARAYASVGFGVGRTRNLVLLEEPWESPACQFGDETRNTDPDGGDFCYLRDTVRTGMAHVGIGGGAVVPIGGPLSLVFDASVLFLGLDELGINVDGSVGLGLDF